MLRTKQLQCVLGSQEQRLSYTYHDTPDVLQALKPKNTNVDKNQR